LAEASEVQLKRGVLELCVLAYLATEDNYAYEIAAHLSREIGMGEGTIYPLVRRMQAESLIEDYLVDSPSGPPRRYYRLTKAGRASLNSQRESWNTFSRAIDRIVRSAR
jgi:PadR family transcriptional regulator, regulatory protein PadR